MPERRIHFSSYGLRLTEKYNNLKKIETSNVKPLHNVTETTVSIRNDDIEKNNTTEEVLKNAPERAQNFFKVPKVVE